MKKLFVILITLYFITSSGVFAQDSDNFQTVSQTGFRNSTLTRHYSFGFWGPTWGSSHRWHNHHMWHHPRPFFQSHHVHSRPVTVNVVNPDPFRYEREREMLANAREARRNLALITVSSGRFFRAYSSDAPPAPMAEVTVINNSDLAVSRIFFRGRIESEITNRVLIDDIFNYDLPRPLNPGEREVYRIPLRPFGRWANWASVRPPDTITFTVIITGITTSSGESIRSN